jgi:predicted AAA+ superfamily ATPase
MSKQKTITSFFAPRLLYIITGARRVGKSRLARLLAAGFEEDEVMIIREVSQFGTDESRACRVLIVDLPDDVQSIEHDERVIIRIRMDIVM